MNDWIEYVKGLPWKDWATTIIAGVLMLLGIAYTQWDKRKLTHEDRQAQDRMTREKLRQETTTMQGEDLTARFTTLMNGYEGRIKDVTTELAQTRIDLAAARMDIERVRYAFVSHQDRCRSCPYYAGLEPINAG